MIGADDEQSVAQAARFRLSGLSHLTAVSGANVTFIVQFVNRSFNRRGTRDKLVRIVSLLLLLMLGFLARWQAGVSRAVLMHILMVYGRIRFRKPDAMNILAGTSAFLLIARPFWLIQAGFWLSFLASASVLLLSDRVADQIACHYPRMPDFLVSACAAGICAQVAVLPISIYLSGMAQPLLLLFNIPAMWFAEYLTVTGLPIMLAVFLVRALPMRVRNSYLTIARWLLEPALDGIVKLADWLLALDRSAIFAVHWTIFHAIGLATCLLFFVRRGTIPWRMHKQALRRMAAFAAGSFLLGCGVTVWRNAHEPMVRIWFLDVGQGDAALILTRDGFTMLIDGGLPDQAWRVLLPCFRAVGISALTVPSSHTVTTIIRVE